MTPVEPIRREVELAEFTSLMLAAYPPDANNENWTYQLNAWQHRDGVGTAYSISCIGREGAERVRDALNVLLTETQP